MTQTLNKKEDPLNLGGGWSSSVPFRTWSSYHRRRRGAPIYKRRYHYGPKPEFQPPRKQPKPQHCSDPWFQPPQQQPYWATCSDWERCGGPWHPPLAGFRNPLCPGQMIRVYGLHPFCLCCCSCWREPWNPGWMRPPSRKKRWGHHRGRGVRRHPGRSFPRSQQVDLSKLLRPVNLYGWRAPGMRAPRNTTQFIMNQVYQDMREQEKLEHQQEALRAQQAQAGELPSPPGSPLGNYVPLTGGEEESLYSLLQDPSLALSPIPVEENESPFLPLLEEEREEKNDECEQAGCDEKEEEEEEEEESDTEEEEMEEEEGQETEQGEEGEEEEEEDGMEEEGLEEQQQRREENHLPLEMPLSILVAAEEERDDFINYSYLNSEQIIPKVPQEALFMLPDINKHLDGN
ncbi:coiled-coil domain-containing glutamate-rich protein 1 [Perognathus longimembris pacificus]|uniref:coiled-coil domain-containing glutamate-rich protein 1 n=1 Tax=Perognathus longimembris pacificus TaxID=214514 RepID=UPI0020185310|nr:coiled-coil domain-containing glutamate-rich protein 1 [Perognathus longimembris pacificus]